MFADLVAALGRTEDHDGTRQVEQAGLFYEFSLERHVPPDHFLRSIDRFVELSEIRRELTPFYSRRDVPRLIPS